MVVGAGPAGIITALEVARGGFDVLLVESGRETFSSAIQHLADAAELDSERHATMWLATRRAVGGTSVIWGGRCVPYDPVDFERRPFAADAAWPVTYDDIAPFFQRACDWLVCGRAVFDAMQIEHLPNTLVPGLPDGEVRTSMLERWSLPTNFGKEYREQLRRAARVRLITGLTCTEIVCGSGNNRVAHLECRTLEGKRVRVTGRAHVVACGGLESTRLLLVSRGPHGGALGDHSGHLGRWYMGHVEGSVANVHFFTPPRATIFGYERDLDGVYLRRRVSFTRALQLEHELPNIVAWLANPELADPRHRKGELSFAYLALTSPLGRLLAPDAQRLSLTGNRIPGSPYGGAEKGTLREHLRNIVADAGSVARFAVGFGAGRFLARERHVPGFFVYSPRNVYPLQYHAEHCPNSASTVALAGERDAVEMPRLRIDIRFSPKDIDGVIRAHELLDNYLRRANCGRLNYLTDDVAEEVSRRLGGGFHQVGTTRMSARPEDGVVDRHLAVHGVENLYVASSSTFVTSSQANSTFMIVAFAVRLADDLRLVLRR